VSVNRLLGIANALRTDSSAKDVSNSSALETLSATLKWPGISARKVASPRLHAIVIRPLRSPLGSTISTEYVGCDFEKINQPWRKIVAKNLGDILEGDVYIWLRSNGIQRNSVPSLCQRIAACDLGPAAHEKARLPN
jgi:hypothetical protein